MQPWKKRLILFGVLLITFLVTFYPHYTYPYPLHIDEWQHIARIISFDDTFISERFSTPFQFRNTSSLNLITNSDFEKKRRNSAFPQDWIVITYNQSTLDNYYRYLGNFSHNKDAIKEYHYHTNHTLYLNLNSITWNVSDYNSYFSEIALRSRIFTIPKADYDLTFFYTNTSDFTGGLFLEIGLKSKNATFSDNYAGWYFQNETISSRADVFLSKQFSYGPYIFNYPSWFEATAKDHFSYYDFLFTQPSTPGWQKVTISNIHVPITTSAFVWFTTICQSFPCQGTASITNITLTEHHPVPQSFIQSLFENPYFRDHPYQPNLEFGFHLILWLFYKITHLNIILTWQYLPALFAVFSAFTLFFLITSLTKNYWSGILSIFFLTSLKSNVNILGLWFLTPLTMALPLIFLALAFFIRALDTEKLREFIILTFIIGLLAFIHPISAFFVLGIILLYCIINYTAFQISWKKLSIISIVPIFTIITFIIADWRGSTSFITFAKNFFIFHKGWGKFDYFYSIPQFYGYPLTFLAFLGIYPALREKKMRIFLPGVFFSAFLTVLFYKYEFTPFIPYQRALFYLLVNLVPLSTLGLYFIIKQSTHHPRLRSVALPFMLLIIVFNFWGYTHQEPGLELYHVIIPEEYAAFTFIKEHYAQKIILTSPRKSVVVYPLTKNYVPWLIDGPLYGRAFDDLPQFPLVSCEQKISLLKKYTIDFILSDNKIICNGFKDIYHQGVFIYEYTT